MRKIHDVLRLHAGVLSKRRIAVGLNIGRTTVGDYLRRPLPDWPLLHRELKRPGVTLSLLWEEYPAVHREGYGYSRFFDLYRNWRGQLAPTMRQTHVTGDKLFVVSTAEQN